MPRRPLRAALAALLLVVVSVSAAPAQPAGDGGGARPAARPAPFEAERTVTRHLMQVADGPLAYTAIAEFLPLGGADGGEVAARVFTVTYAEDGADPSRRPVSFVFNGGPGASSAYLHLGALGPKVVAFNRDGSLPRPPSPLVDNPDTWLAFTDLVFVDPVGAGFSRTLSTEGDAERRFWNVEADTRSMAEIVRLWLTRNGRWRSPKFLVGESYGGFRAAMMASELFDGAGAAVNGLIMVSPVVDYATIRDGAAGLLPWAFRLPSYAAAAAALGKVPGTPEAAAAAAERFALTDYVSGLATLDVGDIGASRPLFERVAALTGMPVDLVERHRGRVPMEVFAREILRADGRVVSLYDATFVGADPDPSSPVLTADPYLDGTKPAYATAYADYVGRVLGVTVEVPFRLLSDRVIRGWEWPRMRMPSARDALQTVMALSPGMRLLIAHGRTDLVTPYLASRWVAANLELPPGERDRVALAVYDGGHMMYTLAEPRARLARDARRLVEAALP